MMRRLSLALLILTLVGLLALAGCGGGSSDPPAITKAQLIKQGDAICEKADDTEYEEANAYDQKHSAELKGKSPDQVQNELLVIVGLPSILQEGKELEALGYPPGAEKQLNEIYEGLKAAVAQAEHEPAAIDSPNGPFASVDKLAEAFGFKACNELA